MRVGFGEGVGLGGRRAALVLMVVGICGHLWEGRAREDRKEKARSLVFT